LLHRGTAFVLEQELPQYLCAAAVLIIPWIMLYVYLLLGSSWSLAALSIKSTLPVNINGFVPEHHDQYVCVAKDLNADVSYYMTKFSPMDKNAAAHHILLYGCPEPGMTDQPYWSCGEMSGQDKSSIPKGPICRDGTSGSILFAEAMQAGEYQLPDGVGFLVGKGSQFKYLVIQVHYGNIDAFSKDPQLTDMSGIMVEYQTTRTQYLGAIYLMVSGGNIPPNRVEGDVESLDIVCDPSRSRNKELVAFAFRTHAHSLGKLITGFRVRNNDQDWTEMARKSPQMEQTFYPMKKPLSIRPSDTIVARCLFSNPTGHTVNIGGTMEDEMCNLYVMYYTLEGAILDHNVCMSDGSKKWAQMLGFVPAGAEEASTELSRDEQHEVSAYTQHRRHMMGGAH
jgi:peptidylglycine monooxygenase